MALDFAQATREIISSSGSVIAVRKAQLKVTRGKNKGLVCDLGMRQSATIGKDPNVDLVLTDDSVSRRHAEVVATPEGYRVRDLGSTNGILIGGVRIRDALLGAKSVTLAIGDSDVQFTLHSGEVEHAIANTDRFGITLGASAAMRQLFATLEQAAAADASVLLIGESGTGKEVVAESLHARSSRAAAPFVVLDCSAISANLIESELFGHEAGAFTGAEGKRAGLIEEADGGTLFIDEIGELPLEVQPKLLRALERREFKRVGANVARKSDFRVVAATHCDLEKAVAGGKFRADLFFRIAVVKVIVPPLRHRIEDIPRLAAHFVEVLRPGEDPQALLDESVLGAFASYAWPGNVRELRNAVERLLAGIPAGALMQDPAPPKQRLGRYQDMRRHAIDEFERSYCTELLRQSSGVVSHAAERADISRQSLHGLLAKHNIRGGENR